MKHLILMADIIKSREKESTKLINEFKSIVEAVNLKFKNKIKSPLTITLGDEFQGVIADKKTSLEIIFFIEEEFIHRQLDYKLRIVLFEGVIDTLVNNKIAYEMLGPGLTEAREKLQQLKSTGHRFFISFENKTISEILNNSFIIFESLTSQWKPVKDFELVSNFIRLSDYKKVAEALNKNRSLIWKRERSLNIESYQAIKNIISAITNIDPK